MFTQVRQNGSPVTDRDLRKGAHSTCQSHLLAIAVATFILAAFHTPACLAGKNAGGALIVHTQDAYAFSAGTVCTTTYGTPASCEEANTRSDKDVGTVVWLLAAFDSTATPGVGGIYFGIDYDDSLSIDQWKMCAPTGSQELPDSGWPYSGRGNSIAFGTPVTGNHLFPFYAFKIDGGTDSSYFSTAINPTGGYATFTDDSFPPVTDLVTQFGTVRWYGDGANECPISIRAFSCDLPQRDGYTPPEDIDNGHILVIGRASREAELIHWAEFANYYCDFPSSYKTVEGIRDTYTWIEDDATAIQHHIRTVLNGKNSLYSYVLLVGDWCHRTEEAFAQYKEIPTWYTQVGEALSGSDGLAATDQPYGDLDGDGLWDVPVFRIMTRGSDQYYAFRDKACTYRTLVYGGTQAAWVRDIHIGCDNHSEDGGRDWLPALAEALTTSLPTFAGYYDTRIYSAGLSPSARPTILSDALGTGFGVIVAGPSSASPPTRWLCFSDAAFRFADTTPSNKPSVMLGLSCYLGAFDYYYSPEDEPPAMCRDMFHVVDDRQGPIAWIGPSRGTYQYIDYWLLQSMLDFLLTRGHTPGQALMVATRVLTHTHPEGAYLYKTFCGFGIPWLPLPEGSTYTGIGDSRPAIDGAATAYPNPIAQGGIVRLGKAGLKGKSATIEVYDVAGRLVSKMTTLPTADDVEINLTNVGIAPGVYFIRMRCDRGDVVTRIVLLK